MATIQGIYLALFGRPADPAGLAYYNGVTHNGADLSGIGNLAGQKEYLDRFAGMGTAQIVQSIYQSLFGRAGEQAGVDFWVGRLATGALSINNIAIAILDGAAGSDKLTVDAKIAAADIFTNHLDQPAEQAAYKAATVGQARDYIATIDGSHPGSTSDVDALIAKMQISAGQAPASGADAVGGGGGSAPPVVGATLSVLDADHVSPTATNVMLKTTAGPDVITVTDAYHAVGTIDGGDGTDQLNVSPVGAVILAPTSIVNIEKLEFSATAADAQVQLTNVQGLTEVWRTGVGHDLLVSGLSPDVKTVGLEGSVSGTTKFVLSDSSGTSDAITLAAKNVAVGNQPGVVVLDGFEHITLKVEGASNLPNLEDSSLKSLSITGNGDLFFSSYIDKLSNIDASQHVGATEFYLPNVATNFSFLGGPGDDSLVIFGGNKTLTGGAGSDLYSFANSLGGPKSGVTAVDVITDFNPLEDYLIAEFGTGKVTHASDLTAPYRASIVGAATLNDALATVAQLTSQDGGDGSTMVFVYKNDTYIYNDRKSDGIGDYDSLIKLTGLSVAIDPNHLIIK